jgi:ABC-2 type transport system ATP-binding protein
MFGVIGPDGAGKTTTLRLICGLLAPDAGTIRVQGDDPYRRRRSATAAIGYVSQQFSLYGDLSIDENVAFFAAIHGMYDFRERRSRLLELTGLLPFRTRRADRLSGGMKQKLALACTLIHQPPILVLDEPTTGVDPVSRREFWKLLAEFLNEGLTIVMATPYLDEAERCARVALLDNGRLLALDRPGALQAALPGVMVEVVVDRARDAMQVLRRDFSDDQVQLFGERLHVHGDREDVGGAVAAALASAGVNVGGVRRIVPSLEDVFIELLAHEKSSHANSQDAAAPGQGPES